MKNQVFCERICKILRFDYYQKYEKIFEKIKHFFGIFYFGFMLAK